MAKLTVQSHDEDLVRTYLREVGQHPLIGAEREVALAKTIESGVKAERKLESPSKANGDSAAALRRKMQDGAEARRSFIEANLRLVVSIARRYQGYGLPLLDLIQDGNLGLLRAVEKFDWRRGFKFSTYATWWIRQAITRGLADRSRTIRLPVHVADTVVQMRRVESTLGEQLGRPPTDEELAESLDMDVEQLRMYRTAALEPLSLSMPLGEDGDIEMHELIADEDCDQPLDEAVRTSTTTELLAVLGDLGPRERRILELRFGFADGRPRTLEQVGHEFGLTRERIRQLEAKAIAKLRHPARSAELRAYLD